jgi:hypothetical protein
MSPEFALFSEFVEANDGTRRHAVEQLSRRLREQLDAAGQVLCHRPCGLYVLLPVAVATHLMEGLSEVCEAPASA